VTHHLWSLGRWSYLHPSQGHNCILTQLQKSDPTFNMGIDVMKPVFNLVPKYRVTMLTREEWTRGPGAPPAVKGLIWFTDGFRTMQGTRTGVCGKKAKHLSRKTCYSLSVRGIRDVSLRSWTETWDRPEKYVSICSDSRVAVKAPQAAKTTFPLVRQCQKVLNGISTGTLWG
jgi:hypothetical protein